MKKKSIVAISVSSVILVIQIVLNILGLVCFDDIITEKLIGHNVNTDALHSANGEELATQIESEGIVMVKNEDNTLPLNIDEADRVNVFGWGATDWVTCGSGSGRTVENDGPDKKPIPKKGILEALEDYGVEYNSELTDFYEKFCKERPQKGNTLASWNYQFYRLIEPAMSDYSNALLENAKAFSDTAVVVIGRVAGESSDAPKVQYKGNSKSKKIDDETRTYLEISTEEEALLTYVGANYENVVVLINSLNTMELSFMETIPGLDSCLVVGGTGNNAANAIPQVMYGEISPSGRLADTYAYSLRTNPTFVNSGLEGERIFTNSSKSMYPYNGVGYGNVGDSNAKYPGLSYVDYEESIYLGYKWYETADAEGYYNDYSSDFGEGYKGVVQYPFGYGLSYNEGFSWQVVGLSHKNNKSFTKDDKIEIVVRVTNTGTVEAKDVVQLYYTAPYIPGEIEKAHVNLCAIAKTETLKPNESQNVVLSVDAYDLASYDCYDMNKNGFTGYELDKGVYEFKLMSNAHELHEIKKSGSMLDDAVLKLELKQNERYENDDVTGKEVKNRFTGKDAVDGSPIDGGSFNGDTKSPLKFLSRVDGFEGSFPKELKPARSITTEQLEYNLYTKKHAEEWVAKNENNLDSIITGQDSGLRIYEKNAEGKRVITQLALELGKDFYSEKWDALLNQMTFEEMRNLTLHGYTQTSEVKSIGKPKNIDVDGPAQIGSFNLPNKGTGFPNATVVAQTFNSRLAYDFGKAIGMEAKPLGYDGWYGPGINMHRSAFGGRNYEYYSEDSFLTGLMGAEAVRGCKNAGVYCYLKHLAVYDQEEYRDGLYTFLNEQALREIYLKPFKMAIHDGGATGIMTSYNRLGCVWAGGSEALLTNVVREEWGFNGTILTDYSDHQEFMNMDHAIRNGGDLWMDGWLSNGKYKIETNEDNYSNSFQHALRNASKHIIYTLCNAYYQNSIYNETSDDKIDMGTMVELNQSWKNYVYIVDAVVITGLGLWVGLTFKKGKKKDSVEE